MMLSSHNMTQKQRPQNGHFLFANNDHEIDFKLNNISTKMSQQSLSKTKP